MHLKSRFWSYLSLFAFVGAHVISSREENLGARSEAGQAALGGLRAAAHGGT